MSDDGDNHDAAPPHDELARLDERLAWARADLAAHERLSQRVEAMRRQLVRLAARVSRLAQRVEVERKDVDEIEGFSAVRLLAGLFGDLDERVRKERQEWVAACMRHAAAAEDQAETAAELAALERRLASLEDPRRRYLDLLEAKSRFLAEHDAHPQVERLHLAEREGLLRDELRELDEAIWAGDVARAALAGVLGALGKAQAIGRLDMIAMASTWAKFVHVDDAHRHASASNRALSRFQMELADVHERHEARFEIEVGTAATFADYFFDDLVSDWVVQCRIVNSRRSAAVARTRVGRVLRALHQRRFEVQAELKRTVRLVRELGRPEQGAPVESAFGAVRDDLPPLADDALRDEDDVD